MAEDVSVKMDLEDKRKGHPASFDLTIFGEISASYATTGLVLKPMAATPGDLRLPTDGVTFQTGTDYEFLNEVAKKNGYVFYVEPGPLPGMNFLYFGPKVRPEVPQCPLNVNMGPSTNATGMSFAFDGTGAAKVEAKVQDRTTNTQTTVQSIPQPTVPTAAQPAQLNPDQVRTEQLKNSAGLTIAEALARATGQAANAAHVLTAEGELDSLRYNGILKAHGIAQVRGVGRTYDGLYYVKSVTHSIKVGAYKQRFQLRREGLGTTVPAVIPC
jgi:phage protein D